VGAARNHSRCSALVFFSSPACPWLRYLRGSGVTGQAGLLDLCVWIVLDDCVMDSMHTASLASNAVHGCT
jgi:hypothetical protein